MVPETKESIDLRLEATAEAQHRTRVALVAMTIVALMMLMGVYNSYCAYNRDYVIGLIADKNADLNARDAQGNLAAIKVNEKLSKAEATRVLQEHAIKSWADGQYVSIPLLGIKVSVDDTPILGAIAMLVFSVWILICVRRENETICLLMGDSIPGQEQTSLENGWRIFHGITARAVFTNINKSASAMWNANTQTAARFAPDADSVKSWRWLFFTLVNWFLFLFPGIAMSIVFGVDRWSFFIRSPFRDGLPSPWLDDRTQDFFWSSFWITFLLIIVILSFCVWALRYHYATEAAIHDYYGKLDVALKAAQAKEITRRNAEIALLS